MGGIGTRGEVHHWRVLHEEAYRECASASPSSSGIELREEGANEAAQAEEELLDVMLDLSKQPGPKGDSAAVREERTRRRGWRRG